MLTSISNTFSFEFTEELSGEPIRLSDQVDGGPCTEVRRNLKYKIERCYLMRRYNLGQVVQGTKIMGKRQGYM
jgi:hypothetical protein